jgi:hypothetical protein
MATHERIIAVSLNSTVLKVLVRMRMTHSDADCDFVIFGGN